MGKMHKRNDPIFLFYWQEEEEVPAWSPSRTTGAHSTEKRSKSNYLCSPLTSTVLAMNQFVARFGNDPSIQGAITTDYIYIQWCDSGVFVSLLLDLEGHYSMIVLVEVAQNSEYREMFSIIPLYNTELSLPQTRGFLVGGLVSVLLSLTG
ncbi:hypothetical protein LENED_000780 [Lentinula edodes]|uniref:Uncharacterized protein n=1 Tax=Lentinula edodes TaxID=5353 RepID=A0A1Q3DWX1_LENED|nr:hypothetical protein LENED_000780 [Lentinula edodes]